jgi:DamX protein
MSNFDSNELKPDSSDRPNNGRKSGSSAPKFSNPFENIRISRQHMMIGIGAVILLIIILTITSSLKSTQDDSTPSNAQNINLTPNNETSTVTPGVQQPAQQIQPQEITISPVSPTPTEAQVTPVDPNQQRVEIPGNVVDALPQAQGNTSPPPTANTKPPAASNTVKTPSNAHPSLASLPAGNVTLQLSGASQSNSLEAFAKKQNLNNYWIYETRRDGKPWFVLIYGSYANVQEANKAVATLPADVQAKKPWVKPIRQVHQESKQR